MRILIAALVVMKTFPVFADEADDARRLAVSGRDAYWNCLAREYPRESSRNMPEQEFGALIAAACASERQNFRVALVGYLGMQFPDKDADANLTTANNAIAFRSKRHRDGVRQAQSRGKVGRRRFRRPIPPFRPSVILFPIRQGIVGYGF
jgi:hypothetical protein